MAQGAPHRERTRPREPPQSIEDAYDARLAALLLAPEWPPLRTFLRSYIENTIPEPFETEPFGATRKGWWIITIDEKASWVLVHVWRQLVLQIDFREDGTDRTICASGWVGVDAEILQAAQHSGCRIPTCFEVDTVKYKGKPLRGNSCRQTAVKINNAPLDELNQLVNSDWMLRAARTLNLDLMGGGVLPMGRERFQMPKLVDAIFSEGPIQEEAVVIATDMPIGASSRQQDKL
jgi:hypothetical protein